MNFLLPHPIVAMLARGETYTRFHGVTLFLDISGFTRLTEALMQQGKHGAEELAEIVNNTFRPIITTVYAHGAFISGFAGDAFNAIFPWQETDSLPELAHKASLTAWHICQMFTYHTAHTPVGDFPLAVKIGLAFGEVECGIVGHDDHRTYYYRGPAIDACGQAAHLCQQGEIIISHELREQLRAETEPVSETFWRLVSYAGTVLPSTPLPVYPVEPIASFYPSSVVYSVTRGEFRRVACVFLAFQDFERHALDSFAQDIIHEVDAREGYFTRLDFGDKGGNCLILFGAPVAHENDLVRALQLALCLRDKYGEKIRCGVTLGQVYFGLVGIPERCEIGALGRATNFAARLMMQAAWGQILVSDRVAQNPTFAFTALGEFAYKGLAAPVLTYQVDQEKGGSEPFFNLEMVGRDGELQTLLDTVKPVLDGHAAATIIYGEAGIGKSRLTYALRQALGTKVLWLTGQTDSILRQALNPFVYLLRQYFQQNPYGSDDNRAHFEHHFRALTAAPLPEALHGELLRTQSFLGALLNLRWPDSLYEQLQDARLRYENTLTAVRAFLLALTYSRPVVVELEDGHWFDEATRELLARLTRQTSRHALWIVITSRYADDGSCPTFPIEEWPVTRLELGHLLVEDLQALMVRQLGGEVHEELAALLAERSQGVPFFVQQFIFYLSEAGALENREGRWFLNASTQGLPDSLTSMLIARLDRLSRAIKQVVQTAAVLGREFDVRLLAMILATDVAPSVQSAAAAQIWSALNEIRYLFKHTLLRDAAYDMQLRAHLRELHQLALNAYEQVHADDRASYYDELAFHAERSGNLQKQREYFRKAGQAAQAGYRNAAALSYYERLLPLLAELAEQINLHLHRGAVLELIGQWDKAETAYRTALSLAEQNSAFALIARSQHALGGLCRQRGDFGIALKLFQQAKNEWEKSGEDLGLSQVLSDVGITLFRTGEYPEAKKYLEQSLHLARKINHPAQIATTLIALGNVLDELGDFGQAQGLYQEGLAFKQKQGDQRGIASGFNNLGLIAAERGQYETAIAFYEKSLAIKREIGDKRGIAASLNNLGETAFARNNYTLAQTVFRESLTICQELGDKWGIALVLSNYGDVARLQGDYSLATQCYSEALSLGQTMNNKRGQTILLNNLGHVASALGQVQEARAKYIEALVLANNIQHRLEMAHSLIGLANLAIGEETVAAQRATHLLGAADHLLVAINARLRNFEQQVYDHTLAMAERVLGRQSFTQAWDEGKQLTPDEVLSALLQGVM